MLEICGLGDDVATRVWGRNEDRRVNREFIKQRSEGMKKNPFPMDDPKIKCFGNWCLTMLWQTLTSFHGVWTGNIYVTRTEIVNLCNFVNDGIFRHNHPGDVLNSTKRAALADQIWLIVKDKLKANPNQIGDLDGNLPNPIGKNSEQLQERLTDDRPLYSKLAYYLYLKVYGEGYVEGLRRGVTNAVAHRIQQALTTHHGEFSIAAFSDVVLFIRKKIAEQTDGGKATVHFDGRAGGAAEFGNPRATLEDIDAAGARRMQGRAPGSHCRPQSNGDRPIIAPAKRRRHNGA